MLRGSGKILIFKNYKKLETVGFAGHIRRAHLYRKARQIENHICWNVMGNIMMTIMIMNKVCNLAKLRYILGDASGSRFKNSKVR